MRTGIRLPGPRHFHLREAFVPRNLGCRVNLTQGETSPFKSNHKLFSNKNLPSYDVTSREYIKIMLLVFRNACKKAPSQPGTVLALCCLILLNTKAVSGLCCCADLLFEPGNCACPSGAVVAQREVKDVTGSLKSSVCLSFLISFHMLTRSSRGGQHP